MSDSQLRRNLRLLASTSVVALALTAAPVSVRVLPNAPAWHLETPVQSSATLGDPVLDERIGVDVGGRGAAEEAEATRRLALERLGLSEATTYAPPMVLTLSRAIAGSGGDGDGDGDGDGGGGSGGEAGDSSGSGSGSESDDGASGASSGTSGASSSESGSEGSSGGSFGDVEQVGPSLSQDEEAKAIRTGWQ